MSESEESAEEFINWLCWERARVGQRFYPPEETAQECLDALADDAEPISEPERVYRQGVEVGQHSRAWSDAVDLFEHLAVRGFDPVERANRYAEENDGLNELDWSWLPDGRVDFGERDR